MLLKHYKFNGVMMTQKHGVNNMTPPFVIINNIEVVSSLKPLTGVMYDTNYCQQHYNNVLNLY